MRATLRASLRGSLGAAALAVAATAVLAQPTPGELRLPVPRTIDLTHVEVPTYAAALGNDPVRIFEFVRDQIGHEVYSGSLRGPRGTLLAMAGNSVDRAALLAGLLEESGQKTRFARGTLPEARARALALALWGERQRGRPGGASPSPSADVKAAWDTLRAGVERDYTMIRDRLKKANLAPAPATAGLDASVREAQQHFWVQWQRAGAWVDLDPSFTDASPGQTFASAVATPASLPENLFHRIEIRLRLEEYTDGKPSTRVILSHSAKAAHLSGRDLALSHQPENWTAPAASLASALASAAGDTGRVKPILLIGDREWIEGKQPFRPKPPTGTGLGGVADMLRGAGTRNPVPVATAATLEFDFVHPDGRTETATREIFDLVGRERRGAGRTLTADEVKSRTAAPDAPRVVDMFFDLFFTTGRIDGGHVPAVAAGAAGNSAERTDVRTALRRMSVAFTVVSDALLRRVGTPEATLVAFYPDSPRVHIMEMSKVANGTGLSLDLRRTGERIAVKGPDPEAAAKARVLKGALHGALERLIVESAVTASARAKGIQPSINTSALFERAALEAVPILLVRSGTEQLRAPPETLARLREEIQAGGVVALTPQRAFSIGGRDRLAWWRIDPRTGETVAVTDAGLHDEYLLVHAEGKKVEVMNAEFVVETLTFHSARVAADAVQLYLALGAAWSATSLNPLFTGIM